MIRHKHHHHRTRAGYSLAEMVVVMFLLTVTMFVSAVLFNNTMALGRIAATADRRPAWRREVIDQWREDVAKAESASVNEATLTLQLIGGTRVLYQFSEGQLYRQRFQPGEVDRQTPLSTGLRIHRVQFEVIATSAQALVRAEVWEPPVRGKERSMTFQAALGGNLR
jgi:hypothetical protein